MEIFTEIKSALFNGIKITFYCDEKLYLEGRLKRKGNTYRLFDKDKKIVLEYTFKFFTFKSYYNCLVTQIQNQVVNIEMVYQEKTAFFHYSNQHYQIKFKGAYYGGLEHQAIIYQENDEVAYLERVSPDEILPFRPLHLLTTCKDEINLHFLTALVCVVQSICDVENAT